MRQIRVALVAILLLGAAGFALAARERQPGAARPGNVVLVTLDGARWQDIFGGIDLDLLHATSGDTPVEKTGTYQRYWAATPAERRAKVMPFLWRRLVAQEGFIAGNRALGSAVEVANTMKFSYPGYSELLTGAPHDEVVTSNDNRRYPFQTVLEWLRQDLQLPQSGVAVFGSWETFNDIAEREEGAITINAGYEDSDALHRSDAQLEQLWTFLQSDSQYRGTTTLILTVDHGRGRTAADWTDHGAEVIGAHETWLGCFGPAVTARGELKGGARTELHHSGARGCGADCRLHRRPPGGPSPRPHRGRRGSGMLV